MKSRVKICGITRQKDADLAAKLGVWALGFIFYKGSKRYISPKSAQVIIKEISSKYDVLSFGIFVNETVETVLEISDNIGLDYVQLHGDEDSCYLAKINTNYCKVVRGLDDVENFPDSEFFLIDSKNEVSLGGTGELSNWKEARKIATTKKLMLAGGLNPDNIIDAITQVNAYAYDVNSGIEDSPGIKNSEKMKQLFEAVGNYE